jgi:solute carrier family 8 (sodium/calcium exchanger)
MPGSQEEKFIVFKSCLWELFRLCPICSNHCLVEEKFRKGTKIAVKQECPSCGYLREWSSQPSYSGDIPAGNLQLSGAILFTGASPTKTLRVLKAMNVVTTCVSTFNNHMTRFLVPTVVHTWKEEQNKLFEELKHMDGGLVIGGDGRSDSPGHCAKYGSYTAVEERLNKVIDQQLVQVRFRVILW